MLLCYGIPNNEEKIIYGNLFPVVPIRLSVQTIRHGDLSLGPDTLSFRF